MARVANVLSILLALVGITMFSGPVGLAVVTTVGLGIALYRAARIEVTGRRLRQAQARMARTAEELRQAEHELARATEIARNSGWMVVGRTIEPCMRN